MRLIEADGKKLLERRGLPVPRGQLYRPDEPIAEVAGGGAVKAQLLAGGRGKSGLVRLANESELAAVATAIADRMRAMGLPEHILIEEKIAVEAECYLAWRIDDVRQAPVMLFSTEGGVEIEAHAGGLHEFVWDPLRSLHPHHLVGFLLGAGAASPRRRLALSSCGCTWRRAMPDPGVIPITSNQNATMATRDTATRRSDHDDRAINQLP